MTGKAVPIDHRKDFSLERNLSLPARFPRERNRHAYRKRSPEQTPPRPHRPFLPFLLEIEMKYHIHLVVPPILRSLDVEPVERSQFHPTDGEELAPDGNTRLTPRFVIDIRIIEVIRQLQVQTRRDHVGRFDIRHKIR